MAVHNLRDMRFTTLGVPKPLPYTVRFDEALKDAVTAAPDKREEALADLVNRADARQAHPTFGHLLPVYVAAGAAEGSLSWAQFRFGDLAADAST
jgi:4,5-DOPA dioxygenase extradiol